MVYWFSVLQMYTVLSSVIWNGLLRWKLHHVVSFKCVNRNINLFSAIKWRNPEALERNMNKRSLCLFSQLVVLLQCVSGCVIMPSICFVPHLVHCSVFESVQLQRGYQLCSWGWGVVKFTFDLEATELICLVCLSRLNEEGKSMPCNLPLSCIQSLWEILR